MAIWDEEAWRADPSYIGVELGLSSTNRLQRSGSWYWCILEASSILKPACRVSQSQGSRTYRPPRAGTSQVLSETAHDSLFLKTDMVGALRI